MAIYGLLRIFPEKISWHRVANEIGYPSAWATGNTLYHLDDLPAAKNHAEFQSIFIDFFPGLI